jgi:hypothetical protein
MTTSRLLCGIEFVDGGWFGLRLVIFVVGVVTVPWASEGCV